MILYWKILSYFEILKESGLKQQRSNLTKEYFQQYGTRNFVNIKTKLLIKQVLSKMTTETK